MVPAGLVAGARPTVLDGLDPAARVLGAVLLCVAAAVVRSVPASALGLVPAVLLAALSGLPVAWLGRRLAVANLFVLFLWAVVPFSFPAALPGDVLFALGPLEATRQGVLLCVAVTCKTNAVMLLFLSLVAGLPVHEVGRAMQRLGVPARFCRLLLFTYRYLFVIVEEYRRLSWAAKMRGFRPATSLHAYRTWANMAGMLLVRSYERAERVYRAMLCRGYDGVFRTLDEPRMGGRGVRFAVLCGLVAAGLVVYDCMPSGPLPPH